MTTGGEGLPVPFTAERAEWIRSNVWTPAMRKEYREVPKFRATCPCQWGATSHCQGGQCDRCHRAAPQRSPATVVCRRGGMEEAHFPEPYTHKTDASATGPRYETAAMVWLADRVCRWVCDCGCHTAPAAPVEPVQLDLFAAVDPAPSRVRVYPPGPKPYAWPERGFAPIADLNVTGGVL